MKSIRVILLFCLNSFLSPAQNEHRPEYIPITKDSALSFKTAQEALGIPLSDSIVSGSVSVVSRDSKDEEVWKPRKGMSDPIIKQLISQSHYRDRLVFSDFIVIESNKQIKIDTKTYVFK